MSLNPTSTMHDLLGKLSQNQLLSRTECSRAMTLMLQNSCTHEEIAGFLMGLRSRKESTEELIGLTEAMRDQCLPVSLKDDAAVDIVGTGGDGTGTFNISTAAAFVCAGAGATVAKHGNRSVSSQCGSSDVLEALGVSTEFTSKDVERCLAKCGIAFMFAPLFHTALRHVMPVRRALGVRTCFNILGPLCNPAGVQRHFIGAFSEDVAESMANILDALGSTHIVVVHSEDGMDEISSCADTVMYCKLPGMERIERTTISPADFGISRSIIEDIQGGDAVRNAGIIQNILRGEQSPARDIVVLNAAGALFASGRAKTMQGGMDLAVQAIDDGSAEKKLAQLVRFSENLNQ